MATFVKFNQFVEDLAKGVHNLNTGVLKIMLTNSAPLATNATRSQITEISGTNGYTTGGNTAAFSTGVQTAGVYKLVLSDPAVWTATGGSMGPFRYAVLYNDTPTSPADPLIGYWDYGTAVTLAVGESFTVDLDQSNGVLTLA